MMAPASTMRGAQNGVVVQILAEEPQAIYLHCYGHTLNLAAADLVRNSKIMKDALMSLTKYLSW